LTGCFCFKQYGLLLIGYEENNNQQHTVTVGKRREEEEPSHRGRRRGFIIIKNFRHIIITGGKGEKERHPYQTREHINSVSIQHFHTKSKREKRRGYCCQPWNKHDGKAQDRPTSL